MNDHVETTIDASLVGQLLDAAPDPIIIVGGDGRIAKVNAETLRKFGYARDELIGQPIEILVPIRYHERHAEQRAAYGRSPHTRPMGAGSELFATCKDGTEIPVEISLSPLQSPQGLLVISIVRDITARRKAEHQLRDKADELIRSNAELEQFAYVASHDLQEPLRAIAGSCQLIERRSAAKLDDDDKLYLQFAVDGAKRMQELISDLLEYSRVTSKARPAAVTDCEAVFEMVLANIRVQKEQTGAVITHDPLPSIVADAGQITRLFQNLICNGIMFQAVDGKRPLVHVSAKKEISRWVFSVRDNGIGIDPKYFDRIFVIFRRLHRREEYEGTGIGLAVCKKIVERHGGAIWVESAPGKGSTFYFSVPTGSSIY